MAQPQSKGQWFSAGTIAGMAALSVLAACSTPGSRPSRPASPAQKPAEHARPLPEEKKQQVAILVPTTGPNAALGQSIANAANMALIDSGNQRIRLTVYNTAGGAAVAAQHALADGNRLFLGPLLASDVREVQGIARTASVPVIAFSNDAALAGNGTYVLGFQPAQAIDRVVRYARDHGVTRFAALVPEGVYGQRASTAFLKTVNDVGGRAVSITTYSRDTRSLTAAIRKLTGDTGPSTRAHLRADGTVARVDPRAGGASFDALLIADSGKIAIAALPLLARAGAGDVQLMGTELWNTEPGLAKVQAMQGAWFASVPDTVFRQFADHYRSRFKVAPYRLASFGYDSVLLVNRIADHWQPGQPFPQAALRDNDGFSGVDGAFRFTGTGIAVRALEVQKVDAGTFTVLDPAPARFGK